MIKNTFKHNRNITVVEHNNIHHITHLKDRKHLNEVGVKLFARNLKRAYFNKHQSPSRKNYTNPNWQRYTMPPGPNNPPQFSPQFPPSHPFNHPINNNNNNNNIGKIKPILMEMIQLIQNLV